LPEVDTTVGVELSLLTEVTTTESAVSDGVIKCAGFQNSFYSFRLLQEDRHLLGPTNFMLSDVIGIGKSFLLFPLFCFVPGYVIGWATNLFAFRRRRWITRGLLSLGFSLATVPLLAYLLATLISLPAMWAFFSFCWAGFALILITDRHARTWQPLSHHEKIVAGIAAGWVIVAIASLMDLQVGERLYFSTSAADYSVRSVFTAEILRNIPPDNPLFVAGESFPLRYHWVWMLVCSLPARLSNIQPRQAMYGGTVWCGLMLMAMVALYVKFFPFRERSSARTTTIAIVLLGVTGLDILPTAYLMYRSRLVHPDMEYWNGVPISSWVRAVLWAPHHMAAVTVCLFGFLVLWQVRSGGCRRERRSSILVAALAFGSAATVSVLLAFIFALFLSVWVLFRIGRKGWPEARLFVVAGLVASILVLPFFMSLHGAHSGGKVVSFDVRPFTFFWQQIRNPSLLMLMLQRPWQARVWNFLFLPLNYFLEFGAFLIVFILRLKANQQHQEPWPDEEKAAWTIVATCFLVGSFLRSGTLAGNDLGFNSFFFAQFVAVLWTSSLIERRQSSPQVGWGPMKPRLRALLLAMIALGVLGTVYQLTNLRFYAWLSDYRVLSPGWHSSDFNLGRRTYALRQTYELLEHHLPAGSVIQHNPRDMMHYPDLLYTNHASAAGVPGCATEFGGNPTKCRLVMESLSHIFDNPQPGDAERVDSYCQQLAIDLLVVKDTDAVWRNREGWIWTQKPLLANRYVRVFACGRTSSAIAAAFSSPATVPLAYPPSR
jgi:hypothetical protein